MNLTLRQLRAFVLVARSGSFTRAAKSMHLTQSALSQLIRELEGALNTRLVDRTTRSVSLTVPGKEFVASAQRILDDLEQAIGNVDKLVAKQRGRVVIASPVVLASNLLPPIVAMNIVWPSGGDVTIALAAISLAAPGLLSMTNG